MTAPTSALLHIESRYSLGRLRDGIATRKLDLVKQLASGLASDHADYKYRIGVLNGLDEALLMLEELEKNERN